MLTRPRLTTRSTRGPHAQGHVGDGEEELAAAALAITFTNVTGLSVGIGLLCAIDTLCSQAYGARTL